jgi:hypothetical protein
MPCLTASIHAFRLEMEKCSLSFAPSLAPTRLLRLVEQQTECKTIELVHKILNLRLLEQLYVLRDGLADDITQALVASGSCRVYTVSRLGKLGVVPENDADLLVLLNAELLQSGNVVFVCHLVHLGVGDHVIGGALKVTCGCAALTTDKYVARIITVLSTSMVRTNKGFAVFVKVVASMWKPGFEIPHRSYS